MNVCTKCKHENPSAAKYCMSCGALLIEEEYPSDGILLRKELGEVKDSIELLKKSLAVLQEKNGNTESNAEMQQLRNQIVDSNETIKTMSNHIDEQKSEISNLTNQLENEKNKKKGGKWGWAFVFLWLITAFGVFSYWDCYTWEKGRGDRLCNEIDTLDAKYDSLQSAFNELQNDYDTLRAKYPIIIKSVEIAGDVSSDRIKSGYGEKIHRRQARYLKPRISYVGYVDEDIRFTIKWYFQGYVESSYTEVKSLKTGFGVLELNSKDHPYKDKWPYGYYRIEIWSNGVALASQSFEIYY